MVVDHAKEWIYFLTTEANGMSIQILDTVLMKMTELSYVANSPENILAVSLDMFDGHLYALTLR